MPLEEVLLKGDVATLGAPALYRYGVYGISLRSQIPLPLPHYAENGLGEIEVQTAPASVFSEAVRDAPLEPVFWRQYARLGDKSSYVRWDGVGEFLISADGRRITVGQAYNASHESFLVYLLAQALSFALVKSGIEPLHGTSVVVDGEAVVFLGDSGYGKSSLAACFLQAGYPLLTDDVLVVDHAAAGMPAYPGPPRIKLFPKLARLFLPQEASAGAMNPATKKQIITLGPERSYAKPVPLRAIYVLVPPRNVFRKQRIRIEPLSHREAFVALVGNTFNYLHADADRLHRQFDFASRLVSMTTMRKLSYPRSLNLLPQVRQAILDDLSRRRAGDDGRTA